MIVKKLHYYFFAMAIIAGFARICCIVSKSWEQNGYTSTKVL